MALKSGTGQVSAHIVIGEITYCATAQIRVVDFDSEILSEDFNIYTERDVPSGWTFDYKVVEGQYIKIVDEGGEKGKSLKMNANIEGSVTSSAYYSFPEDSGPISLEFDFKADFGPDITKTGTIVCYLLDGDGKFAVSLLADPVKGFWYLDGTNSVSVAPAESGKWYHIKMLVNAGTDKMDLYIDGCKVVNKGNLRTPVNAVSKLRIGASSSALQTQLYWDNFRIVKQVPVLSQIMIGADKLPDFKYDLYEYTFEIPEGNAIPVVSVQLPEGSNADVEINQAADVPGTAEILVTAEDGSGSNSYIVHFTESTSGD